MPSENPITTAWEQIRDRVRTDAAAYRERGDSVCEVFADHGAVRQSDEGPVRFSFTISGETATALEDHIGDRSVSRTQVQYADVDQVRFYVLDVHDRARAVRILVAGGVRHQSLLEYTDASGPARTVLRSVTGTTVLELEHESVEPFLAELER
jgi:ribosomal protein S28E/S33